MAQNYLWKRYHLSFRQVMVRNLNERKNIVLKMHEEIGHFGKQ
jgi:hypothetical protein